MKVKEGLSFAFYIIDDSGIRIEKRVFGIPLLLIYEPSLSAMIAMYNLLMKQPVVQKTREREREREREIKKEFSKCSVWTAGFVALKLTFTTTQMNIKIVHEFQA